MVLANARSSQSAETRSQIAKFAEDADAHLDRIQRQLNLGKFKFGPAKGVAIPKRDKDAIRPIIVAPIDSRIVQRAVHDVLLTVPTISALSNNPFSFGGVKKESGNHLAAVPAAIAEVLRGIEYGAKFVIRSDISSFFDNIPKREILALVEDAVREPSFFRIFEKRSRWNGKTLQRLGAGRRIFHSRTSGSHKAARFRLFSETSFYLNLIGDEFGRRTLHTLHRRFCNSFN